INRTHNRTRSTADKMDMSLDDIIRSKKGTQAPSKKFGVKRPITQPLRKTLNKPVFRETRRITDARLKIIQKNRAKIRDARDKLAEITRSNGDVRKKLMQKQDLTTYNYEEYAVASRLSRTVENDMAYEMAPPAPRRLNSCSSSR
ncbi:hypothetical protein DOY81_013886, partial [Sarcophaga bullata]